MAEDRDRVLDELRQARLERDAARGRAGGPGSVRRRGASLCEPVATGLPPLPPLPPPGALGADPGTPRRSPVGSPPPGALGADTKPLDATPGPEVA